MRFVPLILLCAVAGAPARAQDTPPAAALDQGSLTVWVVSSGSGRPIRPLRGTDNSRRAGLPAMLPSQPVISREDRTIHEQTAASFGTVASDAGQTAGSYGQTAGSLGIPASEHGVTAGEHGQTSGSFGQTAGSVGQTASTYGQTAGSFGQPAASYGETLGSVNAAASHLPPPTGIAVATSSASTALPAWSSGWQVELAKRPPTFHYRMVAVEPENLERELLRTMGTPEAPDVLLGNPLPASWWHSDGLAEHWGLTRIGVDEFVTHEEVLQGVPTRAETEVETAILKPAPHPEQARAFVALVAGGGQRNGDWTCESCSLRAEEMEHAAEAAKLAYSSLLSSGDLGPEADPQAAAGNGPYARAQVLRISILPDDLKLTISATGGSLEHNLALVSLQAVLSSARGYGVVHGLAVLRLSDDGKWRVLQLSPNLQPVVIDAMSDIILKHAFSHYKEKVPLAPVSLAAPREGEIRTRQPELWWDPGGGSALQVVEWQHGSPAGWGNPHLLLVPDQNAYLRTRVRAEFATSGGAYRWRVWSVDGDGKMVFSGWRTFTVIR